MAQGRQPQSAGGGGNPSQPQQSSGIGENFFTQRVSGFDGLNYNAGATEIGDQELLWCHNLHPIAPGKLRAMFEIGSSHYTVTNPRTIIGQPHAYTLGAANYIAFKLDDNSLWQINAEGSPTATQILPPGALETDVDFTQWGSRFLLIVSTSTNGYWIWDGARLFKAGTVGPIVTILSGGSGYSSMPAAGVIGGTGSGAVFTGTIEDGAVATMTVTNPGTGWLSTDPTPLPIVFDNGAGVRSAHGHATVSNGVITSAVIDKGGKDYTSIPTVTVTDGGGGTGSGADIIVDGVTNGQITSLHINDGGTGYGVLGTVTLAFAGGGGSDAEAHVVLSNGVITGVTMDDHGIGYVAVPDVVFITTLGTGATGTAILKGTTIDSVDMTIGGSGYNASTTVVFNSSNGPAYATIGLMPFGLNGISIATFQSRVWISHHPAPPLPSSLIFSNVSDPSDFGPPGGAVPFTEEYLRYKLSHLVPSDSFLYLIGDSSVSYITNVVQTTTSASGTSPAITTFQIVNTDPQTGTPWRDSVYPFEQSVLMVNSFGIHTITGGNVKKASTQIDDLFSSDPADIGVLLPSTAVGQLNGVRVFGVLWPVLDPTTLTTKRLVLLSDGRRWWTYQSNTNLISIFTSEIDSELTLWGHDGTSFYKLWQTPSSSLPKKLRTKLYTGSGIVSQKRGVMAYGLVESTSDTLLSVKPVTEAGLSPAATPGFTVFQATTQRAWKRAKVAGLGYVLGWQIDSLSPNFTIDELLFLMQEYTERVP